jgi:hypothetical protein
MKQQFCKECGSEIDADNHYVDCQMCGLTGCQCCITSTLCDMCMDDLAWSRRMAKEEEDRDEKADPDS